MELKVPNAKRGGKTWSSASAVNQQISEEIDFSARLMFTDDACARVRSLIKFHGDSIRSLASLVLPKMEEGDFKRAVRLACSEDSMLIIVMKLSQFCSQITYTE